MIQKNHNAVNQELKSISTGSKPLRLVSKARLIVVTVTRFSHNCSGEWRISNPFKRNTRHGGVEKASITVSIERTLRERAVLMPVVHTVRSWSSFLVNFAQVFSLF